MRITAWQQFLDDQSDWPTASQVRDNGAARDTTSGTIFAHRRRMDPQKRHRQILQAATKIIAAKGFWGMSLQDVADEIGITEAALYHYIASKNDLLTMVINEAYDTPAADEYNASNATISDCCGHRVCFYPRYCLN